VTPDEFPDAATVRRKVGEFERQFVAVFCDAFQCLAPLNQLAAVSVATRPDRANQAVSLLQYLESDAIPLDLLDGGSTRTEDREFFLTIDPARHVTFCQRCYAPPYDRRLQAMLSSVCLSVCLSVSLSISCLYLKRFVLMVNKVDNVAAVSTEH